MLDSGAFSVWNKGAHIDFDKYVEFCVRYPEVHYYVNLDVIPGKPGVRKSITKAGVEESCLRGFENYKRMKGCLPLDKLIPVFHMNDDVKWIDRYLSDGVTYLGVSPANDRSTRDKLKWLNSVRKHLFDGAGRPLCRTHGFAVTSHSLMKHMRWHSVDSASWKQTASWGAVYIPQLTGGAYDYSKPPFIVAVSPASPTKAKKFAHYDSATPLLKERVRQYVESEGMCVGESDIVSVDKGYKLRFLEKHGVVVGEGESWVNRSKGLLLRPVVVGVSNSFRERCRINIRFVKRMNKALSDHVKHVYLAGAPMPYEFETKCGRRLLSFHEVGRENNKYWKWHIEAIKARGDE